MYCSYTTVNLSIQTIGLNQTASNELNEDDIIELSKIAQLGQFNDINNGNTSTIFYGGIIFPKDFDYDKDSTSCTGSQCINMNYTIRFGVNYNQFETDTLYSKGSGPSNSGKFLIYVYPGRWHNLMK